MTEDIQTLLNLPDELLYLIAAQPCLTNIDRRNMALTCTALRNAVYHGMFGNPSAINPTQARRNPLVLAARRGYLASTRLLLQDPRLDPGFNEQKPLRIAAELGHSSLVKLLLNDARVDPSIGGCAPLVLAASQGHFETVEILLADPRVADRRREGVDAAERHGYTDVAVLISTDPRTPPKKSKTKKGKGSKKSDGVAVSEPSRPPG